jgi:hypothetical protein
MDIDVQKLVSNVVGMPSSAPVLSNGSKPRDPLQAAASAYRDATQRSEQVRHDIGEIKKVYEQPGQELAGFVRRQFEDARSNKSAAGIDCQISDSLRLRRGEYTQDELSLLGGESTSVWFPLVERQCKTAIAFLRNVMNLGENRLFELSATPVPDLPEAMKDFAADYLMQNLQEALAAGMDVDAQAVEDAAARMRETLIKDLERRAEDAARIHTDLIDDQLKTAGWETVFDGFIEDFVTYPAAVIAGPEAQVKYVAKWKNGKLRRVRTIVHRYRNVDPARVYPSPDSSDVDDGQFIIEVKEMTRRELQDSKSLPGWMPKHIDVMVAEYRNGYSVFEADHAADDRKKDQPHKWTSARTFEVIRYYGQIPGEYLKELGINEDREGRDINVNDYYESEVFVLGDLPIRAVLVKREHEARPYYAASMYSRVGSFWGTGVPLALHDFQRLANSVMRSMVRNLGFSSAPIFTVDDAVASTEQGPIEEIIPGMTIRVNSLRAPGAQRPVDVMKINPNSQQYLELLAQIVEYAELAVGFPRYLLGAPATGGAARTLGGLSLLQSNAAVLLKSSVRNIDNGVIKRIVEWRYYFNLATSDDDRIKADAEIVVKGADYLLTKEVNKGRLLEGLNIATPYVQAGFIKPEGVSYLLRELFSDMGLEPDKIVISPDVATMLKSELQAALGAAGGAPGVPGVNNSFIQSSAGQQATQANQDNAAQQQGAPAPSQMVAAAG